MRETRELSPEDADVAVVRSDSAHEKDWKRRGMPGVSDTQGGIFSTSARAGVISRAAARAFHLVDHVDATQIESFVLAY
jgi:hypothetical protein